MELTQLLNESDGENRIDIAAHGKSIPVKFRRSATSRHLLVKFHGAVDRKKRPPPRFVPTIGSLGDDVAQLSISDPLLLEPGGYAMTWYGGSETFPSQNILLELILKLIALAQFERVVFFGTSAGGFASLFYAAHVPGSIAVVGVPQTNILRYYDAHTTAYRKGCWPSLGSNQELTDVMCTNVCELYSKRRDNTVIYLQSAGDSFHTRTQFAPFLNTISRVEKSRFIAWSGFWGRLGHSDSITRECYLPWLKAAFASPTIEVDDLLVTHRALTMRDRDGGSARTQRSGDERGASAADTQIADLLRDYHLRQAMES